MDIRIGIAQSTAVIELELDEDTDRVELRSRIDAAIADDESVLWVTDKKGRDFGVPSERIAFVEIGSQSAERRIGFGA